MTHPPRMRQIDSARGDARAQLLELRNKLSIKGDVVTPEGAARTRAVFGADLSPRQVVERICADVRDQGLPALLAYTQKLDRADLDACSMRVSDAELSAAARGADPDYIKTLSRIRENIFTYQTGILHRDATLRRAPGFELGLRYRPLRRVGVCIPGGAAAYPSSLLMTVVPAQAAGVREIAVVVPPTKFGGYNPHLLAACHFLGAREVYRVGGAQAVAALAYGVEGLPPVDKIVGPGNLFVALAKKQVFGEVDIDSIAGPSEVIVLADWTANPSFVAADLISQAEHAPGASILITWSADLVPRVEQCLNEQLAWLDRGALAGACLEQFGAIVIVRDEAEAIAITNEIAPEHLHISTADPNRIADQIQNAGAMFLGHDTPVALGDYAAGPSHVLPTGGTARWASGLSANDFLKRTSTIQVDRRGLQSLADDVCRLAEIEGLTAHRHSVEVRLSDESRD